MLEITELVIDVAKSLGNKFLLVSVRPAYEYQNGVRTENVSGYRYEIVLQEKNFEKISFKIEGKKLMDNPEVPTEVNLVQPEIYLYWTQEGHKAGARAQGITPLANQKASA